MVVMDYPHYLSVGKDTEPEDCQPSVASSDLMKTIGKLMAHCIALTGFCMGNLAPSIYRYIVYGNVHKALPLLSPDDISNQAVQDYVVRVSI